MTMVINRDNLVNHFGMIETQGDEQIMFPLKKVISVLNEESEEERELAICITRLRNISELCLSMLDGNILYLAIDNIEDLKVFERCIESYEPVY